MQKVLISLILLFAVALSAQIRGDYKKIPQIYQSGDLQELSKKLERLSPKRDEEHALVLYYKAMLKSSNQEALDLFNSASQSFPRTQYGQLSMLEAAKIHILERDIPAAQALLRKISSAEVIERFYWLAVTFYWMDDYSSAIANAENYIRLADDGRRAETALHLIADAYIAQKKYLSAISSLDKIKKLEDYDQQYLKFKEGYAQEFLGNDTQALQAYRQAYELDEYSQVAFDVEERLFALRSRKPSVDLSFLYPYTPLELKEKPPLCPADPASPAPSDSTAVINLPALSPVDKSMPIKLLIKPARGSYLQAGRFSVEANAERLVKSIREMKVPASYYEDESQENKSWVVLAGPFEDRQQTDQSRMILSDNEIHSFVVRY